MIFTWLTDQSICNQKSNRVASKRLPLLIVMPSIWPAGCSSERSDENSGGWQTEPKFGAKPFT